MENASKSFAMDSQIMEEVIKSGNIPVAGPGKNGMLSGGGGLLPPALLDENRVPKFYLEMICACGGSNSSTPPNTAPVYNLMVTSGLPRHVLSYIWSAVNRTLPGQLTRPEFFSCLALIALAQKGESLAALSTMDSLPIPYLNTVQAFPSTSVASTSQQSAHVSPTTQKSKNSFIPTSLLPRRAAKKKKDLIDVKSGSATTSPTKVPASSSGVQDLVGIDWSAVTHTSEECSKNTRASAAVDRPTVACWKETIHAVFLLFQEANELLGKANDSTLSELATTQRGSSYLNSLAVAFDVMDRVCRSAGVMLPAQSTTEAEACRKCWKMLIPHVAYQFGVGNFGDRKCAICGQPLVNAVEYGGQCYDAACANLWVNTVSSLLPNLHLR